MTTLETLKWDGKKSGKVTLDLAVAKGNFFGRLNS